MSENVKIRLSAVTDTGRKRTHNEDSFTYSLDLASGAWGKGTDRSGLPATGIFLMVADGMGGMEAGEVASAIAVDRIKQFFDEQKTLPQSHEDRLEILQTALEVAHQAIVADGQAHQERQGMGTTATLAWIVDSMAYIAWSGDSRVYLFDRNENTLTIVSEDHSLVWEMVMAGSLDMEQARIHPDSNIITQSLGDGDHPPRPDHLMLELQPGDRLLLCSDGLNSMLPDQDIADIMAMVSDTDSACETLVSAANEAGGYDNITTLLFDLDLPPVESEA